MNEIAEDAVLQEIEAAQPVPAAPVYTTTMGVLVALSMSHMMNDTIQAVMPAIYPLLKENYALTFTEIGLISVAFMMSSSVLQPLVGLYTDRNPKPYSLAMGMGITLCGLVLLSFAGSYRVVLVAAALIGAGSAIFHPEASRLAHLAAGRRHGFAQSLFQVGGNFGSSLGPLLAAWIIVPRGQGAVLWFSLIACVAIIVLSMVGRWYAAHLDARRRTPASAGPTKRKYDLSRRATAFALGILVVLIMSKFFYMISLTNYYTFYLIDTFGVSVQTSQIYLFVFLFAVAAGTIAGGPLGDHFGRKAIIWVSILGVAPFSLALPHMGLTGTVVLSMFAGAILASAFSAILVFAQELVPGRVGLVAGLFFGFAFGISGIASAALGKVADWTSIGYVFQVCAYLPLLGIFAAFLPGRKHRV